MCEGLMRGEEKGSWLEEGQEEEEEEEEEGEEEEYSRKEGVGGVEWSEERNAGLEAAGAASLLRR